MRRVTPQQGGTTFGQLTDIFGESQPVVVSNTPRPAGNLKPPAEPIAGKGTAIANGWIYGPAQTAGMSVLYVDQILRLPGQGIQGHTKSAIGESAYVPFNHYRAAHWLFAGWDPIFRYANTYLDVRFAAGSAKGPTNETPNNLPGSARWGTNYAPFRVAWQVPRFSTEPNTIVPKPGR